MNAYVVVKCVQCGATKKITSGELKDNDFPMCEKDYMPMLLTKAVAP